MGGESSLDKLNRDYMESGRWKCSKSPTGAHYWVEVDMDGNHIGYFMCKYCLDVKRMPVTLHNGVEVTRRMLGLKHKFSLEMWDD